MSYSITLYRKGQVSNNGGDANAGANLVLVCEDEIASMDWLRNPFGLCTFVEDNVGDRVQSLWHVCNDHAYKVMGELDRRKFRRIVLAYWDRLRNLDKAYFYFDFHAYVQFTSSYSDAMVIAPNRFSTDPQNAFAQGAYTWRSSSSDDDPDRLGIRVERFQQYRYEHFSWGDTPVLDFYKDWFKRLVNIAEVMQDLNVEVHIST